MSAVPGRELIAATLLMVVTAPAVAGDPLSSPLTLAQAELIAGARDAGATALVERAGAWRDQAVAERQLPDPELRAGLENLPTDSLSRAVEPMTMASIGLAQRFPPAGARAARGERGEARAHAAHAAAALRRLDTLRAVRTAYLALAEAVARAALVHSGEVLAGEREAQVRARYAGAEDTQQTLIEAGIESARWRARSVEAEAQVERARAGLARWVGADAARPLPPGLPPADALPAPPAQVPAHHPELAALDAETAAAQAAVALARAAYHPEFAVEARYGERAAHDARGRELSDLASVMLTTSLPLFTAKRQDRTLAAAQARLAAARHARIDRERALAAAAQAAQARAAGIARRLAVYADTLVPRAELLTRSTAAAVAGGTQAPEAALRARLTTTEIGLERLEIAAQALRARIELAYLGGL